METHSRWVPVNGGWKLRSFIQKTWPHPLLGNNSPLSRTTLVRCSPRVKRATFAIRREDRLL